MKARQNYSLNNDIIISGDLEWRIDTQPQQEYTVLWLKHSQTEDIVLSRDSLEEIVSLNYLSINNKNGKLFELNFVYC